MTDKPTFQDPPAPVDLEPPPRPPGLLARILAFEAVALLTWLVLAYGGAANLAGLPALAVAVAVGVWLTGRK